MDVECTVYKTVDIVSRRWALLILLELYRENGLPKRYSILKKSLPGITPKILSLRLKELEKDGLVMKKVDAASVPVKCEYSLTEMGAEFVEVVKKVKDWALKWKVRSKVCERTNCAECKL